MSWRSSRLRRPCRSGALSHVTDIANRTLDKRLFFRHFQLSYRIHLIMLMSHCPTLRQASHPILHPHLSVCQSFRYLIHTSTLSLPTLPTSHASFFLSLRSSVAAGRSSPSWSVINCPISEIVQPSQSPSSLHRRVQSHPYYPYSQPISPSLDRTQSG
jgi:hypothetical protein